MSDDPLSPWASATVIAAAFRAGRVSATEITHAALDRVQTGNPRVNAYTDLTAARALREAQALDARRAGGDELGPLSGVPYAVKNLFDVRGLPTRAGSKINLDRPPAKGDATLITRMGQAGAVLLGTLGMGEYAYDFTGENAHDGICRNPHDLARMSGGSSSGSGAATAAGLAPVSLGSDTNGSLRVPASLCGVFSLKPTYGRLARGGTFPFVDSLDHLGPMARGARDLALGYQALQGPDPLDHACRGRVDPISDGTPDLRGLRVGVLQGWFHDNAGDEARAAVAAVADTLAPVARVSPADFPAAEAVRASAYLITNSESAGFHLDRLRARAGDFDPDTRDRFLAGALLPAAWISRAQRVRHWGLQQALRLFDHADILLAPATPCAAPLGGTKLLRIAGRDLPLRPSLGLLAQPFSAIGLPVVTVPAFAPGALPIGVQIIAAPWREDLALQVARYLEEAGTAIAHAPSSAA